MKISPLKLQNITKIRQNKQNYNKNNLKKDIFIKTNNQVVFQGNKFDDKFTSLYKELNSYFLNTRKLSEYEIKTILKKHLPNIKFEIHPFSLSEGGFNSKFSSDIKLITSNGKSKFFSCEPVLYTNIITTPTPDMKEATKVSLLHECVHALQDNSKDRISKADFLNFLSKKYPNLTIKDVETGSKIFNQLEQFLTNIVVEILNLNTKAKNSSKLINQYKNFNFDNVIKKHLNIDAETLIYSTVSKLIKQNQIKNGEIIFDYILYEAQRELEAYKKTPARIIGFLSQANEFDNKIQIEIHENIMKAFSNYSSK